MHARLPLILALVLLVPSAVPAAPWRVWESDIGRAHESEVRIMNDGSVLTLHHHATGTTSPADRVLLLQSFDPVRGAVTTRPVATIGTEAVNQTSYQVRLAGNGLECWALWRTEDAAGNNSLKAAKVFPTTTPFIVETITTNNASQRFDACLGADGLPRAVFVRHDLLDALAVRRRPDGTWEQSTCVLLPPNTVVHDVAIAPRGDRLDVFICTGENRSLNSGLPGFRSVLSKFHVTEPATWSDFLAVREGFQTWDEVIYPSVNFPVADHLDAEWTPDERLAVTYTNRSTREAVLAHWKAGILEVQDYHTTPGSFVPQTGLAVAADGSLFACYLPFGGVPTYRHWQDGSFGPPVEITEMEYLTAIDIGVDPNGFPWLAGVQPGTFPVPKFQIGVALDHTDEDHDGFVYLLEDAFHTDPNTPDFDGRPIFEVFSTGGQEYLSLTYLADSGGTGNNPYVTADFEYRVEVSDNALAWSDDASRVVLEDRFTISGRGTVNRLRSTRPIASQNRELIRVRVTRR